GQLGVHLIALRVAARRRDSGEREYAQRGHTADSPMPPLHGSLLLLWCDLPFRRPAPAPETARASVTRSLAVPSSGRLADLARTPAGSDTDTADPRAVQESAETAAAIEASTTSPAKSSPSGALLDAGHVPS